MDINASKFDMMNCAGWAYQSFWQKRQILFKAMLIPLLLKMGLNGYIFTQMPDASLLRQSLIRVPDFFFEGWLVVGFLYLIAFDRKSIPVPFGKQSGQEIKAGQTTMISAILIYVLTSLFLAGYSQAVFEVAPFGVPNEQEQVAPEKLLVLTAAILFVVLQFRLLWMYIPKSFGLQVSEYLKQTGTAGLNLKLFGLWLIAIIPLSFVFFGIFGLLVDPYVENLRQAPLTIKILMTFIQSLYELLMILIQAGAVYYAVFYEKYERERLR